MVCKKKRGLCQLDHLGDLVLADFLIKQKSEHTTGCYYYYPLNIFATLCLMLIMLIGYIHGELVKEPTNSFKSYKIIEQSDI